MSDSGAPPTLPPVLADSGRDRLFHCLQAAAFVGVWMALGWGLHPDPNTYLLLGVPLVILFQRFVRRQPLIRLWVRDADRFRLDLPGLGIALLLAILPVVELAQTLHSPKWNRHLPEILWLLCSLAGALAAAFSLRRFTAETWRALRFCFLTAGAVGCLLMAATFLTRTLWEVKAGAATVVITTTQVEHGLHSLLLYLPVGFLLEEVAFRGALDAHVQRPGGSHGLLTAFYISALWGLWHLPISGAQGFLQLAVLAVLLPLIHMATGVFLSLSWRRSGNLAVTALVHAFIDAVRNMLLQ